VEGVDHLPDTLDLRSQVIGHFCPRGFVLRVKFVTEGFTGIESHRQVLGSLLLQQAHQHIGKAKNAGSGFASPGLHTVAHAGGDGKIRAVSQGVTID